MKVRYLTTFVFAAASWAGGCADSGSPEGSRVAIAVAPLTLPGTTGVEYALAVFNAAPTATNTFDQNGTVATNLGNLVWNEPSVTSNQYGNSAGGDISYVGTCDASLGGTSDNWVALALKQIAVGAGNGSITGTGPNNTAANTSAFATGSNNILDDQITALLSNGGDGDADFENPCPFNKPCVLKAPCDENKDTEVEFNLTIMRDAEQGFFDIAVNFEDVFCSAKFDTCYNETGDQSHIELLFGDDVHDGAGRDWTGVYAMACTAGAGTGITTELLLSDVVIRCGAEDVILPTSDLTDSAGNQIHTATINGTPRTIHYAIYHGKEELSCGAANQPCNKAYANIAIDLENLPTGCTLHLQATVQDANKPVFTADGVLSTGGGTSYPFINVDGASLEQACTWDALNDGGNVETFYGSNLVGGIPANPMTQTSTNGGPLVPITLSVVAVDPAMGTQEIQDLRPAITFTFNQALNPSTVTIDNFKLFSCDFNSQVGQGIGSAGATSFLNNILLSDRLAVGDLIVARSYVMINGSPAMRMRVLTIKSITPDPDPNFFYRETLTFASLSTPNEPAIVAPFGFPVTLYRANAMTVDVSANGKEVTLEPTADLPVGAQAAFFVVSDIGIAVQSALGDNLLNPYASWFMTAQVQLPYAYFTPEENAFVSSLSAPITLDYYQSLVESTVTADRFQLKKRSPGAYEGTVNADGDGNYLHLPNSSHPFEVGDIVFYSANGQWGIFAVHSISNGTDIKLADVRSPATPIEINANAIGWLYTLDDVSGGYSITLGDSVDVVDSVVTIQPTSALDPNSHYAILVAPGVTGATAWHGLSSNWQTSWVRTGAQ